MKIYLKDGIYCMPKNSKTLGYYYPSFFEMNINSDQNDLSFRLLPLKDLTVVFHEYIHFLQDFSTYYCLNSLFYYSEYFHSIISRIDKTSSKDVVIPFEINDNNDNVNLNNEINELTIGETGNYYPTLVINKIDILEDEEINHIMTKNDKLQTIPIVVINPNSSPIFYGAHAIMESMAYIMERLCSPKDYLSSPDFPYCAAELVAKYYVPEFSDNLLMVLALCDMSLMSSNPGFVFVKTMLDIKEGRLSFSTPEDIYNHFYFQTVELIDFGVQCNLIEAFVCFLLKTVQLLKTYLDKNSFTTQYFLWLDNLMNFAIDWRVNNPFLLLNMARQNKLLNENTCFISTTNRIGSPLMSDNIPGVYCKIPPYGFNAEQYDVEFFKVFHEIGEIFLHGNIECSLQQWCKESNINLNELCKSAPWKRCHEKMLCPFSMVWKSWGLCGINLVKRKDKWEFMNLSDSSSN